MSMLADCSIVWAYLVICCCTLLSWL